MGRVQDPTDDDVALGARSWIVPVLYTIVIAGNLLIAYDWWRSTPQGQRVLAQAHDRYVALRDKAKNCEGCARRRAALHAMTEHLVGAAAESAVMEAEAIVRDQP